MSTTEEKQDALKVSTDCESAASLSETSSKKRISTDISSVSEDVDYDESSSSSSSSEGSSSSDDECESTSTSTATPTPTPEEGGDSEKKKKKKKLKKSGRLHRSKREKKPKEEKEKSKEDKDKKHKKIPSFFNMFSSLLTNIFSDKKAKAVESKRLKDWRESTSEIFARPTSVLPIHKDLPRLAKKVIFVDRRASAAPADVLPEDPQSPLKNTADAAVSIHAAVGDFLWKAAFVLCGGAAAANELRKSYNDVIKESIALDVQSESLKQFVADLGEEHPVARLLKGVNQSITAPANIEIHTKILQKLLFKDSQKKPWNVFVHVTDDDVTIEHIRVQTNLNQLEVDSAFEFTLVTRFVLSRDLAKIVAADVFISSYEFGEGTSEEKKDGLKKMFDAAPKPAQTKNFDLPPRSMAKVGINILSE